jgi:hypothetical protein
MLCHLVWALTKITIVKMTVLNRVLTELWQRVGKLCLVALVLTVPAVAAGTSRQDPARPLQVDGEVVHIDASRYRESDVFDLKVKLRFTNTSEKPVILLLGTYGDKRKLKWWVLDRTLSLTLKDALDGNPFSVRPMGPANSKSFPYWKDLRRQLKSSQPPASLTHTIQPHGTFFKEIETVVVIHDDEVIPPDTKLWLRVFLELWPFNIEPAGTDIEDSPYGESLRQKWKAFGDLQLEPILSAPIPFDRPSSKASGRERFYGDARANHHRADGYRPPQHPAT